MDVVTLMDRARQAGLTVRAEGDTLVVQGPKRAAAIAEQLLEHKAELMALLDNRPPICRPCGRNQHEPDVVCPSPPSHDPRYPVAPGYAGVQPEQWDAALADAWIAMALERIGRLHDKLAPDCDIDTREWDRAEAVVNAAYVMQNRQALRDALDAYEQHARAAFEAWANREAA